ncbi:hypothetical protein HDU97_004336 [Phlyctochytrium planicorne]|nr:hypothetical protein HDU97_004336 [Phlyctochytrium planicorne]
MLRSAASSASLKSSASSSSATSISIHLLEASPDRGSISAPVTSLSAPDRLGNALLVDREMAMTPGSSSNTKDAISVITGGRKPLPGLPFDLKTMNDDVILQGRVCVHVTRKVQDFLMVQIGFVGTLGLNADALMGSAVDKKERQQAAAETLNLPNARTLVSVTQTIFKPCHLPSTMTTTTQRFAASSSSSSQGSQPAHGSQRTRVLFPGRYEFPFTLHIPNWHLLPPSIKTQYGQIRYELVAALHRGPLLQTTEHQGTSSRSQANPFSRTLVMRPVTVSSRKLLPAVNAHASKFQAIRHPDDEEEEDSSEMSFSSFLASGRRKTPSPPPKEDLKPKGFLIPKPDAAISQPPPPETPACGVRMVKGTSKSVLFEYRLTVPKEVCIDGHAFGCTLQLHTAPGANVGHVVSVSAALEERRAFRLRGGVGMGGANCSMDDSTRQSIDALRAGMASMDGVRTGPPVDRPRRRSLNLGLLVSMVPRPLASTSGNAKDRGRVTALENESGLRSSSMPPGTKRGQAASKPVSIYDSMFPSPPPLLLTTLSTIHVAPPAEALQYGRGNRSPISPNLSSLDHFIHHEPLSKPIVYPVHYPPLPSHLIVPQQPLPGNPSPSSGISANSTPALTYAPPSIDDDTTLTEDDPLDPIPSVHPFVMSFKIPVPKEAALPDIKGIDEIRVSHLLRFRIAFLGVGGGDVRVEDVEVNVKVLDGVLRVIVQ